MIFFAALGIALTLTGYSCFTLRIDQHRSMLVSHFLTYYVTGLVACYFLKPNTTMSLTIGVIGIAGALFWYFIVHFFHKIERRFGRNERQPTIEPTDYTPEPPSQG